MTWDEAFAHRYGEWSANMTADIDFYVGLARQTKGPLVELAVGNGRVAICAALARAALEWRRLTISGLHRWQTRRASDRDTGCR